MVKTDPNTWPWAAWSPWMLQDYLRHAPMTWYVVGGWALDLWHGEQTREHSDLEFCILRQDFALFQNAFADLTLYAAKDGAVTVWDGSAMPHADLKQFWALGPTGGWVFDMMIEDGSTNTWIYKRNHELTGLRSDMVRVTKDGIRYLRPGTVLLFKAKHLREKDCADFDRALPRFDAAERAWLKDALEQLHPGHVWTTSL